MSSVLVPTNQDLLDLFVGTERGSKVNDDRKEPQRTEHLRGHVRDGDSRALEGRTEVYRNPLLLSNLKIG